MKRIINILRTVVTLLLLSPALSYAAEPERVSFNCNIHTINEQEGQWRKLWRLDDDFGGYVVIRKSRHPHEKVGRLGLILYKDSHSGHFWAFDIECPCCKDRGVTSEVQMETNIVVRCPVCGSEWQNIHMGSTVQTNRQGIYHLKAYHAALRGDTLYVSDNIRKIMKNG